MPETADAVRMRLARQAARRRSAVTALQIAEATARYGASVLANGCGPAEARAAAMECAAELTAVAEVLRRAVRPSRAERKALAVRLTGLGGLSARQAADRLGCSERTIWRDLGRPLAGQFTAQAAALGQVAGQQPDTFGGGLDRGDAPGVLLGADVAERLVKYLVGLVHRGDDGGVPVVRARILH